MLSKIWALAVKWKIKMCGGQYRKGQYMEKVCANWKCVEGSGTLRENLDALNKFSTLENYI